MRRMKIRFWGIWLVAPRIKAVGDDLRGFDLELLPDEQKATLWVREQRGEQMRKHSM